MIRPKSDCCGPKPKAAVSSTKSKAKAKAQARANAKSKAKAMGLWQFMPATGKIYGLKQNLYVDERMDLVKSTESAIAYLKRLKKMFGK